MNGTVTGTGTGTGMGSGAGTVTGTGVRIEDGIKETLESVGRKYGLKGEVTEYTNFINGHINGTYKVTFSGNNNLIFQKINSYVFKDPLKVMHNIKVISEYLDASAAEAEGCGVIRFMNSLDGENYAVCDGNYWRVCRFVDNSVSFETAEDPRVLRSAGYAFGRFQRLLAGLPMGTLYETIPDFHNTKKRLSSFFDTAAADPEGRLKGVMDEVKFFERNASTASKLCDLLDEGSLPLRVTHNDTKYNNILLDKDTLEPLCVIDLDTVMPGLTMYDFGDAVRFAANRAVEDETDLRRVGLDPAGYEEFTNGFISASRDFLTEGEVANMALGAIVITIELASRFLADHINGDKYFRIHRENHNLDRARCQIRLAEDMMYRFGEMNRIVRKYYQ